MKVQILRDSQIDIGDVVMRSPVADDPESIMILRGFIFRSSEFWVGKVEGKTACIFGLIPPSILSDTAYLWLLTTDAVDENTFLFVRHSQQWMEQALKRYSVIHGHVAQYNRKAKRWLEWLGAEINPSAEGGRHAFVIKAK